MSIEVYDLKVNDLFSCYSADKKVKISWKLNSVAVYLNSKSTVSLPKYFKLASVLLSKDFSKLENFESDFTAKTSTLNHVYVKLKKFEYLCKYYFRIKILDENMSISYSKISSFTSIANPKDFKLFSFLYFVPNILYKKIYSKNLEFKPSPIIRGEFELTASKEIKKVYLVVAGLCFYKAYLNDVFVNKGILAGSFSDYKFKIEYQTYEIKTSLLDRKNCLVFVLAENFFSKKNFDFFHQRFGTKPVIKFFLKVFYVDGTVFLTGSNEKFKAYNSPYCNNLLSKKFYYIQDKQYYDFFKISFNASLFKKVNILQNELDFNLKINGRISKLVLKPQITPYLKSFNSAISPKEIKRLSDFVYLLEFKSIMTGYLSLFVKKKSYKKDQPIKIDYYLNIEDLRLNKPFNSDVFLFSNLQKSRDEDEFVDDMNRKIEDVFLTRIFLFVKITGLSKIERKNTFAYSLTPYKKTEFLLKTSSEKINNISISSLNSLTNLLSTTINSSFDFKYLNLRELLASYNSFSAIYDISSYTKKILEEILIYKNFKTLFYPNSFYANLLMYFDRSISIKLAYQYYLKYQDKDFLISIWSKLEKVFAKFDFFGFQFSFLFLGFEGDIEIKNNDKPSWILKTRLNYAIASFNMSRLAEFLNLHEKKNKYTKKFEIAKKFLYKKYFYNYTLKEEFQSIYTIFLYYNLIDENKSQKVFKNFLKMLKKDRYFKTNEITSYKLFHVLSKFGGLTLAYDYLFFSKNLFNFNKNRFFDLKKSSILSFLIESTVCVKLLDSLKIEVHLQIAKFLNWAYYKTEVLMGVVELQWKKQNGILVIILSLPPNTQGLIYLPGNKKNNGEYPYSQSVAKELTPGINKFRVKDYLVF